MLKFLTANNNSNTVIGKSLLMFFLFCQSYSTPPGKEMFIISHGKVECIITTASGERKTVAVLVAGQSFGEIALLGVEGCSRRTADVR